MNKSSNTIITNTNNSYRSKISTAHDWKTEVTGIKT